MSSRLPVPGFRFKKYRIVFGIFIFLTWNLKLGTWNILWAAPPAPQVEKTVLSNGIRVLLYPHHSFPGVAFRIYFRVGSVDEEMGQTGLAHMFEHMAFKGTQTINAKDYAQEKVLLDEIEKIADEINRERGRPGGSRPEDLDRLTKMHREKENAAHEYAVADEYERMYEANGSWGFNAFTSNDMTGYMVSLPSNRMDVWLKMESDRFQNAVLREFYRERDVVMEERRMRVESDPLGKLYELFMANAFVVSPYRHEVVGWMSDLERITATQAQKFFDTRYTPSRCVIALVGDFEPKETLAQIRQYFEGIPGRPAALEFSGDEPLQTGRRRVELVWDAEPLLLMGWHKPNPPSLDSARLTLLKGVLADGRTSRFYKEIVEKSAVAQSVSVYPDDPGVRYPNLFLVLGYPRGPHDAGILERAVELEIDRVKKEPPADWELERVRNSMESELVQTLEENEGFANAIAENETLYGDWSYSWKLLVEFETIKPEDLSAAARQYLTRENKTVGYITKKKGNNL
ncbi:MAG: insulinase family protein [Elusimicrobia bacterium]|nr:insulinase family protein [Elusimicrobiota bacterium]